MFDDYAHHPTEVLATAKSIGKKTFHESWVVFECHSYSRLFMHMDEFSHALELFDHVIVTDIYAARETNTYQVHESDLVSKINEKDEKAIFISGYDAILEYLKSHVQKDDIVLTMGAGTITKLADKMMNEAKKERTLFLSFRFHAYFLDFCMGILDLFCRQIRYRLNGQFHVEMR